MVSGYRSVQEILVMDRQIKSQKVGYVRPELHRFSYPPLTPVGRCSNRGSLGTKQDREQIRVEFIRMGWKP